VFVVQVNWGKRGRIGEVTILKGRLMIDTIQRIRLGRWDGIFEFFGDKILIKLKKNCYHMVVHRVLTN